MARIRGPLLSMNAKGSVGKSVVFSKWRGLPYARQHVVPGNPQTVDQMARRNCFQWLNALYRQLPALATTPWQAAVFGRPLTERNLWVKVNLQPLVVAAQLTALTMSPGALAGPAPASIGAVAGGATKEIDITLTPGELPVGWDVLSASFFAIRDQVPVMSAFNPDIDSGTEASPGPYQHTLTMASANESYYCFGWFVYTRPDGRIAYSVSPRVVSLSAA